MMKLEKILWPTDFSDNSNTANLYATSLAKEFSAELHMVHVIVDPAYALSPVGVGYIPETYHEEMEERSDAELATLASAGNCSGLEVRCKTLAGNAAEAIVDYAEENQVSMIIMGTHGYTGLSRLVMGSVAERVVRSAHCPVLTVHPDDRQFIEAA